MLLSQESWTFIPSWLLLSSGSVHLFILSSLCILKPAWPTHACFLLLYLCLLVALAPQMLCILLVYMPSLLKSDANGKVATQVCSRVISHWHRCEPALPESAVVARNIWQEYLSCPISGIQKPEQVYGSHGLEEWDKANWHLSGLGNQLSLWAVSKLSNLIFFLSMAVRFNLGVTWEWGILMQGSTQVIECPRH